MSLDRYLQIPGLSRTTPRHSHRVGPGSPPHNYRTPRRRIWVYAGVALPILLIAWSIFSPAPSSQNAPHQATRTPAPSQKSTTTTEVPSSLPHLCTFTSAHFGGNVSLACNVSEGEVSYEQLDNERSQQFLNDYGLTPTSDSLYTRAGTVEGKHRILVYDQQTHTIVDGYFTDENEADKWLYLLTHNYTNISVPTNNFENSSD